METLKIILIGLGGLFVVIATPLLIIFYLYAMVITITTPIENAIDDANLKKICKEKEIEEYNIFMTNCKLKSVRQCKKMYFEINKCL